MAELTIHFVKSVSLDPVRYVESSRLPGGGFYCRNITILDGEGRRTVINLYGDADPSVIMTADEQKAAKEQADLDAWVDEQQADAAYRDQLEDAAAKERSLPTPF